jgi:hypothetical protein
MTPLDIRLGLWTFPAWESLDERARTFPRRASPGMGVAEDADSPHIRARSRGARTVFTGWDRSRLQGVKSLIRRGDLLERTTGFEPATLILAKGESTHRLYLDVCQPRTTPPFTLLRWFGPVESVLANRVECHKAPANE